jgi:negative regulator of sigma E activity
MDRKELQALLDEHFETPLEGERLEMLDRALTQDPELRREFEAHRQILETLRTLTPPSAPASLRGRILAQARAEIEEKGAVPTDASSPRRKATVFSLVRTVCTRWQVQTLAAACLAVVLFYQVLPQLDTSLRQRDLFEKIAQSPSDSQEESKAATIATDLERHNRDAKSGSEVLKPDASPANQPTRSAGDLHYFYNSKPSDASPEIAPPIPFLTGDVPPAPGSKQDATVADSPQEVLERRNARVRIPPPHRSPRRARRVKKRTNRRKRRIWHPLSRRSKCFPKRREPCQDRFSSDQDDREQCGTRSGVSGKGGCSTSRRSGRTVFRASGRDTREESSRLGGIRTRRWEVRVEERERNSPRLRLLNRPERGRKNQRRMRWSCFLVVKSERMRMRPEGVFPSRGERLGPNRVLPTRRNPGKADG